MRIEYIGAMPGGTLKDPITGNLYDFKRNEPIEVPDSFAPLALENPEWKESN